MKEFLVFIFLGIIPFSIILYSLYELYEEIAFKKKATVTTGTILQRLPSRHKARGYDYRGGTGYTSESQGDSILIFEYQVEEDIWEGSGEPH